MKKVAFGATSVRRRSTVRNASELLAQENRDVQLTDLDDGVLGLILMHLDVSSTLALACTCKVCTLRTMLHVPQHVLDEKLRDRCTCFIGSVSRDICRQYFNFQRHQQPVIAFHSDAQWIRTLHTILHTRLIYTAWATFRALVNQAELINDACLATGV